MRLGRLEFVLTLNANAAESLSHLRSATVYFAVGVTRKKEEKMLTVVLPTRNEAKALRRVMDEIRSSGVECVVLVVDHSSTDGTREIAVEEGAVLLNELRKGKGVAVREGFGLVTSKYVVMSDADFTYPLNTTLGPIYSLLSSGTDIVVGYRKYLEDDSMSLLHRFGNWGLSLWASILLGRKVHDVCSGLWGFRREALDKLALTSDGFTLEADLWLNVVKAGCSVEQLPIAYRKRLEGSKSKLTMQDGFKIAWFLLKGRVLVR